MGNVALGPAEAHHLRHVLRLGSGEIVEVFDASGRSGRGTLLVPATGIGADVNVEQVYEPSHLAFRFTVASAVPKGNRADWMIEKLSELGAERFIPLAAARSVVRPEAGKISRWQRIATEAARQSRRAGIMQISELADVPNFFAALTHPAWILSTVPDAISIGRAITNVDLASPLALVIGPEGGWTDDELFLFQEAALTSVRLGTTILRIETAAVAAAAIVSSLLPPAIQENIA